MTQEAIEALLREKIGLEANSLGSSTIARSIRQRMLDSGLPDMQTYLLRLRTSTQELEALIENIIVPETWFFRDKQPFVFLSLYVMKEWLPAHPNSVFRVLSVPCSTGEEPYSIAITLLETGLTAKKIHIDAVDISNQSLLKARHAIYERNSFRGNNNEFRKIYFRPLKESYQLCESIKCLVNFIHGNLFDTTFMIGQASYDAIFCRNLLIYCDHLARERAIKVIERLLSSKGLLFVGSAETGQLQNSQFISIQHPLAFAYRKAVEPSPNLTKDIFNAEKYQSKSMTTPAAITPLVKSAPNLAVNLSSKEVSSRLNRETRHTQESLLETARNLANLGHLNEATSLCETYLSQNPASAEAYFLLGEVRQAAGKEEGAEECFYKAIYLQPNHYEALTHLALLKEQRGDRAGAAVIRQRIQRLYT